MSAAFIRQYLSDYYGRHRVTPPDDIQRREFAFSFAGRTGMARPVCFSSASGLNEYLAKNAPSHAYHSVCRFRDPQKREGWLDAMVPLEFDLSDYPDRPCAKTHSSWSCKKCGAAGRGETHQCPKCASVTEVDVVYCDSCYELARQEVLKLTSILQGDFGLGEQDMVLSASGSRGFQCRVTERAWQTLSAQERGDITSYIMGERLSARALGLSFDWFKKRWGGPHIRAGGWAGRLTRAAAAYFELKGDSTLAGEARHGRWDEALRGMTAEQVQRLVEGAADAYHVRLDAKVARDVVRMFRVVGSVHGGTGLVAKQVGLTQLDSSFNYVGYCGLDCGRTLNCALSKDMDIVLGGAEVKGARGAVLALPAPTATYLIFRNLAKLL